MPPRLILCRLLCTRGSLTAALYTASAPAERRVGSARTKVLRIDSGGKIASSPFCAQTCSERAGCPLQPLVPKLPPTRELGFDQSVSLEVCTVSSLLGEDAASGAQLPQQKPATSAAPRWIFLHLWRGFITSAMPATPTHPSTPRRLPTGAPVGRTERRSPPNGASCYLQAAATQLAAPPPNPLQSRESAEESPPACEHQRQSTALPRLYAKHASACRCVHAV